MSLQRADLWCDCGQHKASLAVVQAHPIFISPPLPGAMPRNLNGLLEKAISTTITVPTFAVPTSMQLHITYKVVTFFALSLIFLFQLTFFFLLLYLVVVVLVLVVLVVVVAVVEVLVIIMI